MAAKINLFAATHDRSYMTRGIAHSELITFVLLVCRVRETSSALAAVGPILFAIGHCHGYRQHLHCASFSDANLRKR
jgi:hypothetical protein